MERENNKPAAAAAGDDLLLPAEMAWASPCLSWLLLFWSQFGSPEILDQLKNNQRKSESLDVNFQTPPGSLHSRPDI